MAHPRLLNHGLRLAVALALLVSVMTSPIRPQRPSTDYGRSDCFRRNFAMPKDGSSHHRSPAPIHARVVQVKALHSEAEEEPRETSGSVEHDFTPPPVSTCLATWCSNHEHLHRAMHPLRC